MEDASDQFPLIGKVGAPSTIVCSSGEALSARMWGKTEAPVTIAIMSLPGCRRLLTKV